MTVKLNKEAFLLYGTCDGCGDELHDIDVDTGNAVCDDCGELETFDPVPFLNEVLVTPSTRR